MTHLLLRGYCLFNVSGFDVERCALHLAGAYWKETTKQDKHVLRNLKEKSDHVDIHISFVISTAVQCTMADLNRNIMLFFG